MTCEDEEERTRSRAAFFKKLLGKSQTSSKKRVARSRDRRAQNDLYLPRSPSERSQKKLLKFLLFIIARRRERAKRAFFLYLPREIARRNRNEEKRSVRAQNDLKRNARRRRTQTSLSLSLSLSLGFRSFAVSFVVKGHSRRERIIYLRGVGLLQRGKRHAIRFYIKENRSVMV